MRRNDSTDWIKGENLKKLEEWAVLGLTNPQLAKNIGIGLSTFYAWQARHQEIRDAVKKGKRTADEQVENALFKRAIGYKTTEDEYVHVDMDAEELNDFVQIELDAWKQENPGWTAATRDKFIQGLPTTKKMLVKSKTKFVPPDTVAAIFWLKNRKPEEWRDKRSLEMSGQVGDGSQVDLSKVETSDLKQLVEQLGQKIEEGESDEGAE